MVAKDVGNKRECLLPKRCRTLGSQSSQEQAEILRRVSREPQVRDLSLGESISINKLPLRGSGSSANPRAHKGEREGLGAGGGCWHHCEWQAALCTSYLQNDGGSWLLIQDSGGAEQFKGWVGVVGELRVIVNEQGLDVVKDEAKLIGPLHSVQAGPVVCGQGGRQAGQGGGVHDFAHLGGPECSTEIQTERGWGRVSRYCLPPYLLRPITTEFLGCLH